jgi:O-antigen/teichoic acid export membrane protein
MFLVESLNKFINRGEGRSVQLKRNILISFLVKGLSVLINFLIVPITIGYIDQVRYGIWVTITSIITWFAFFDFGMGNGLRNKLTTALAHEDHDEAQKYISTTYAVLILISFSFFVLFCFFNSHINWNGILNIPPNVDENLPLVMLMVMGTFCLQFTLQLINTILRSMQEPAKAELLTFFGQLMTLLALIIIKNTVTGSLSVLVLVLNLAPVAVLFVASLLLFNGKLRSIAPSFKKINFNYAKSILNLGGVFFLIQIGSLVLHQTDNVIITRIIGPEAVTKFNVTYKLYSVIIVIFLIIATPYWSAFTDAYVKKDYQWITKNMQLLRKVWVLTSFVAIPSFFVLAKFLFDVLFPTIHINISLSISMAVYVVCYTGLSLNCYLLYATGKLRVLLILYLLVIVLNVPLGIIMGNWWGIEGVIMANVIFFVFMNIILWVQNNKILRLKASGIWNS